VALITLLTCACSRKTPSASSGSIEIASPGPFKSAVPSSSLQNLLRGGARLFVISDHVHTALAGFLRLAVIHRHALYGALVFRSEDWPQHPLGRQGGLQGGGRVIHMGFSAFSRSCPQERR